MTEPSLASDALAEQIDAAAAAIEPRVIAWRRDLHAHPELGNREFRTADIVQAHLRADRPRRGRSAASPTPASSAC